MYTVMNTFDSMATGRTHNRGEKYDFSELSKSQLQYLIISGFIQGIATKNDSKKSGSKSKRVKDG